MSRRLWSRTVKRFKAAGLGNALAMTHDRRIVNARGSQKRHSQDREDIRHQTPLFHRLTMRSGYSSHPSLFHASNKKCLECCPVSTRALARFRRWLPRPSGRGHAGKPSRGILAAVSIAVIPLTLKQSEAGHDEYENQECPHGTWYSTKRPLEAPPKPSPKLNRHSGRDLVYVRHSRDDRNLCSQTKSPAEGGAECCRTITPAWKLLVALTLVRLHPRPFLPGRWVAWGSVARQLLRRFRGRLLRRRSALCGWRALFRLHPVCFLYPALAFFGDPGAFVLCRAIRLAQPLASGGFLMLLRSLVTTDKKEDRSSCCHN